MELEIINNLSVDDEKEIEAFLLKAESRFNPLFSSPVWAERLKDLLGFKYEFLIVKDKKETIALLLIFEGFRGYTKIDKLSFIVKILAKFYAKTFYSYLGWNNFIAFRNEMNSEKKEEAKEIIYKYLNGKNIKYQNSPIFDEDDKNFNSKKITKSGTYILDFNDKTYEEVYANFRRQARKSIEKTLEQGVYVKKLKEKSDILEWARWLEEAQKETGKSYKTDENLLLSEFKTFDKKNYIYEIFVAYQNDKILGSLGVWGFGDFITEFGVQQSAYAKENKLYVQDVIKNEIVKYCFERNIKYFDLAGFSIDANVSEKEKAIKQFKEKFRGIEIVYNTVSG